MKNIFFFIFFLLVGFSVTIYYGYFRNQQIAKKTLHTTIPSKFSIEKAPSESIRATIASLSGTVNWQSRIADKPEQLKTERIIQQGEELSTGNDGKTSLQIQNDISISLLQNSLINFIQTLPANIVIEQKKGNAIYQNFGDMPLSIRTFDLISVIKQGVVAVDLNEKQNVVTIIVEKGIVQEGFVDINNNSNIISVTEGSQFVFNNDTKKALVQ